MCFAFSSPHCCFHSSKVTFTKLRGCHSAGGTLTTASGTAAASPGPMATIHLHASPAWAGFTYVRSFNLAAATPTHYPGCDMLQGRVDTPCTPLLQKTTHAMLTRSVLLPATVPYHQAPSSFQPHAKPQRGGSAVCPPQTPPTRRRQTPAACTAAPDTTQPPERHASSTVAPPSHPTRRPAPHVCYSCPCPPAHAVGDSAAPVALELLLAKLASERLWARRGVGLDTCSRGKGGQQDRGAGVGKRSPGAGLGPAWSASPCWPPFTVGVLVASLCSRCSCSIPLRSVFLQHPFALLLSLSRKRPG